MDQGKMIGLRSVMRFLPIFLQSRLHIHDRHAQQAIRQGLFGIHVEVVDVVGLFIEVRDDDVECKCSIGLGNKPMHVVLFV